MSRVKSASGHTARVCPDVFRKTEKEQTEERKGGMICQSLEN